MIWTPLLLTGSTNLWLGVQKCMNSLAMSSWCSRSLRMKREDISDLKSFPGIPYSKIKSLPNLRGDRVEKFGISDCSVYCIPRSTESVYLAAIFMVFTKFESFKAGTWRLLEVWMSLRFCIPQWHISTQLNKYPL